MILPWQQELVRTAVDVEEDRLKEEDKLARKLKLASMTAQQREVHVTTTSVLHNVCGGGCVCVCVCVCTCCIVFVLFYSPASLASRNERRPVW